jgi:hypothetical protein
MKSSATAEKLSQSRISGTNNLSTTSCGRRQVPL